jgi:hypothetical protein
MNTAVFVNRILSFLKKNWFKLALVALVLYVFFKKELSFQIQMQTPDKTETKGSRPPVEKVTGTTPVVAGNDGIFGRLSAPFIGNERNRRNALSELSAIDEAVKEAYLKRFARVAVDEQAKFGIPASVILATSLYQSCAGKRELTIEANNHFALLCQQNRQNGCVDFQGTRYRRYNTAWESFRDFSLFAEDHFSKLKGKDYREWLSGMAKSGFGEDDHFAKNVIAIIETYRLFELDT